jgi:hypothetical protein
MGTKNIDNNTLLQRIAEGGFKAGAAGWAAGATAQDLRNYGSAEVQVAGLSGGDTIAFTRSLDGTNYKAVSWIDQSFATGSTVSADGIYSLPGGGYLKWTKTGAASTPTVTVRAAS